MLMWRTFFFAMIPMIGWAQTGPQPDMVSSKIALHEAGIICAPPTTGLSDAPETVAGTTHLIDIEPAFVSTKRRVPAVIGIGFGIKAQAASPLGLPDITMSISHPEMGKQRVELQAFGSSISGTEKSLTFYQFDFDYELVTGFWQMEASQGDEILYRTTFEVLSPDQVPELAQICGFENLLS